MSQSINREPSAGEGSVEQPVEEMTQVLRPRDMRRLSDMSNGLDGNKFKAVNEQVLFSGNSLLLSKFTFADNAGNEKSAEVIKKKYTIGNNTSDDTLSVLSIAILKRHILCDCLLLVKQYRPTLKSYVLEFPAKIIEHVVSEDQTKDDTGEIAIRDLENSTGYKSSDIHHISPETALDPGL